TPPLRVVLLNSSVGARPSWTRARCRLVLVRQALVELADQLALGVLAERRLPDLRGRADREIGDLPADLLDGELLLPLDLLLRLLDLLLGLRLGLGHQVGARRLRVGERLLDDVLALLAGLAQRLLVLHEQGLRLGVGLVRALDRLADGALA